MPKHFYKSEIAKRNEELASLRPKLSLLAWTRLILIIGIAFFVYLTISQNQNSWMLVAFVLSVLFLVLVRVHFKLKDRKLFLEKTLQLCDRELASLDFKSHPWSNGHQFNLSEHPYSNDLDIVGPNSLFQYINRTHTVKGGIKLASSLLSPEIDARKIQDRQKAVAELAQDRTWALEFEAYSELGKDNDEAARYIQQWEEITPLTLIYRVTTWLLAALGASTLFALIVTGDIKWFSIGTTLFAINLVVFGLVAKRILKELGSIDRIDVTFKSYARLIEKIEQASWNSIVLKTIQESLKGDNSQASLELKQLSKIFSNLESMRNGFVLIHFNGTVFYHVHQFHRLALWRKKNKDHIQKWIDVIGEVETLMSLGVFAFNNPSYYFPALNQEYNIGFEKLVHPLIPGNSCVANSVQFNDHGFVILTGSNMSGKSTFLRSLGIAIVLANAGSVVPAKNASFHPIHVLASMRLMDSLVDSTSYFFAEIKRMQFIMETVRKQRCFVLLDELLRGTNSDDKIAGTIGIVEQLASLSAIGVVATHDLEVCETAKKHPSYLTNMCFEANIQNDQLHFDYILRPGICKNRSASFLLEKHNVIPRNN